MLKRYKNYIISSDNEEDDNDKNKQSNNLKNKEKINFKNNIKIPDIENKIPENRNLLNVKNDNTNREQKFFEDNNNYKNNLKILGQNKNSNIKESNEFIKAKKEEKISIKKIIYCEPCDKRLENHENYLLHMSSKRHKYKMRELLKKELKKSGSSKKVLIKEKMIAPYRRWKINNARYLLYGFALNRYLNK